jgi:hypothetical protein
MGVEVFFELRLVRDVRAALTRVFSLATKKASCAADWITVTHTRRW